MKRLRPPVEDYLKKLRRLEPVKLGPRDPGTKREPTPDDNCKLSEAISQAARRNSYTVAVALSMVCVLFAAALFLVFNYRTNIGVSLGGGSIALAATFRAVAWLRQLTIEITLMQVSLSVLKSMRTDQATEVLNLLYWAHMRPDIKQSVYVSGKKNIILTSGRDTRVEPLNVAPQGTAASGGVAQTPAERS